MPRLILLVVLIFIVWYWWRTIKGLSAEEKRPFLWRSAFWLVLTASLILVVSGRMHWVGAGLAALLPLGKSLLAFGFRAVPILRLLGRFKTTPSQFKTKSLNVTINFSNSQMDGEVLIGELAGKNLSELTDDQLENLAVQFKDIDRESYALLYAYRIRRGSAGKQSEGGFSHDSFASLSESEAYEILGLDQTASKEDVIKAHKRLVQRLHPDRGGSDYLAAKINAAKDRLA
ncbi:DnaJ domain-containing protein [Gammaproteobacteria bacterium]|nr:DnaJ domain-containing protein [Gammaproteobacteria bacterium]